MIAASPLLASVVRRVPLPVAPLAAAAMGDDALMAAADAPIKVYENTYHMKPREWTTPDGDHFSQR